MISGSVSVTLGAMSLTTPLVALYFGSVSLAGIFSNLLLLWLVTLIFHGSVLVVLVSLGSLSWAYTIAKVLVWPIRLLLSTAKFLGNLPLASVFTASPYVALWLVFVYVLLVLFLFAPRKMPGRLLICGLTGLILSLVLSWAEPRMDDCRVTMLDVGQGQSILLQSRGSTYLVDCGGSSDTDTADVIAETLLSQGIRAIDGVILTHMDRDHTGALSLLRTRIRVGSVYTPDPDADGILVQKVKMISCGSGEITIIGGNFPEDDQENGLCVLFEAGNCAILITGDRSGLGEMMLMESYPLPNVDLLIAGHHGSAYSTSDRLLQLVQPDTVFISAGKDNAYGHPADALLTRLESYGCQVFRTDLQGTLLYRR